MPHWSSRARSTARYQIGGGLRLLPIEADQQPWCPELDGELRVSSLQTPANSQGLATVRSANTASTLEPWCGRSRRTFVSTRRITHESVARACDDPHAMVALWLIGYEDEPDRSAEICVCEIFGRDVTPGGVVVGLGLHPFADPRIQDDFSRVAVPIDAREFHVYAADWTADSVTFFVDGETVKLVEQSPDYPMQLMLSIYEFPAERSNDSVASYPKAFTVDYVRGYRL